MAIKALTGYAHNPALETLAPGLETDTDRTLGVLR